MTPNDTHQWCSFSRPGRSQSKFHLNGFAGPENGWRLKNIFLQISVDYGCGSLIHIEARIELDDRLAGRFPNLRIRTNSTRLTLLSLVPHPEMQRLVGSNCCLERAVHKGRNEGELRSIVAFPAGRIPAEKSCDILVSAARLAVRVPRATRMLRFSVLGSHCRMSGSVAICEVAIATKHKILTGLQRGCLSDCAYSSPSGPIESVRRISSVLKPIIIGLVTPGSEITSYSSSTIPSIRSQ